MKLLQTTDYLLLIDKEAEIKVEDYVYSVLYGIGQIIRDTGGEATKKYRPLVAKFQEFEVQQQYGRDGIWQIGGIGEKVAKNNCKKVIAYYPLTKEVKELDLPLLPNPFKTYRVGRKQKRAILDEKGVEVGVFKTGSEEQAQKYCDYLNNKQFSLEDMKKAIEMAREYEFMMYGNGETKHKYSEEEIIQSLSTQQLPSEFIPEYEDDITNGWSNVLRGGDGKPKLKTITNSEGRKEIVGTYKYS